MRGRRPAPPPRTGQGSRPNRPRPPSRNAPRAPSAMPMPKCAAPLSRLRGGRPRPKRTPARPGKTGPGKTSPRTAARSGRVGPPVSGRSRANADTSPHARDNRTAVNLASRPVNHASRPVNLASGPGNHAITPSNHAITPGNHKDRHRQCEQDWPDSRGGTPGDVNRTPGTDEKGQGNRPGRTRATNGGRRASPRTGPKRRAPLRALRRSPRLRSLPPLQLSRPPRRPPPSLRSPNSPSHRAPRSLIARRALGGPLTTPGAPSRSAVRARHRRHRRTVRSWPRSRPRRYVTRLIGACGERCMARRANAVRPRW